MNPRRLNLDRWSRNFLILAGLLFTLQAGLLFLSLSKLPPQVPLFYSLPWGEERLVTPQLLWILPAVSAAILIVNLVGSHLLRELVLTRILSCTAFLVAVLSLITLVKIILLGLP